MCFTSGAFNITGDQRWNRWGRGREGAKALFTFLLFYFFTFKSPFLPLKAFFLKNSLNFATLCNIFSNFAPKS